MVKTVDLSVEEKAVLALLGKHRAMSFECIASLAFGGDEKLSYNVLGSLGQKRLVLARKGPYDRRKRYALLSKQGIKRMPEQLQGALLSSYANRSRAEREVEANDFYMVALKAGIPANLFVDRETALTVLGLNAVKSPIAWLVGAGNAKYAVYLRRPEKRSYLLRGFDEAGSKVVGHVIFYPPDVDLSRDRRWFLEQVLPGNVHLLRFEDINAFARFLRDPTGWLDIVKGALDILSPGGRFYRTPPGCPSEWMWDKHGNPLLLGDLSTGNVGFASRIKDLRPDYMKNARWGNAVLLCTRNEREASVWAKLLGFKPWIWFLTEKNPALYQCRGGEFVLFRSAESMKGDDLVAEAR